MIVLSEHTLARVGATDVDVDVDAESALKALLSVVGVAGE